MAAAFGGLPQFAALLSCLVGGVPGPWRSSSSLGGMGPAVVISRAQAAERSLIMQMSMPRPVCPTWRPPLLYRVKTNRMVSDLGFIDSATPPGSTR
jgi:hypothetical protein